MATRRRGRGEGSIYQQGDGRWVGAVSLERGRRKRYYGRTRAEVGEKLARALGDKQHGIAPVPERETVGAFLTRWLEDGSRPTVRPATYSGYERMIRLHVEPEIGALRVSRLKGEDLAGLYRRMSDKGLSPKTITNAHRMLHRALAQAKRWRAVAINVAEDVDPPRVTRREFRTLDAEEARRLMDAAQDDRYHALYVIAVTCGLRQGELLGLRWQDVDLERGQLAVRQQAQRVKGEWVFTEPKTAKGRRTITMGALAVDALRQHRVRQAEERLGAGADWQDLGLVFPNHHGRPVEKQNLMRRSFKPLLARAGLPDIRFHDLRHSSATLLLAEGIHPRVVQERLGHATISVTMDVYSHVMPTMQREAANAMDKALARDLSAKESRG